MSIAVLNSVYDEVRRLAIAGSNLAPGDFRLKKLVEPLRKSAAKAPVFGKVADSIEQLLASNSANSASALLELSTLTNAILYTQGETGIEGDFEPIQSQSLGLSISNTSARTLKPLIEALTSTGAGRLEIIRDAYENGAFRDLRIVNYAITALGDSYSEIADFIAEKVLPTYSTAIYPRLRDSFDPMGKNTDARRLRIMHQLDPEKTRPLIDAAIQESSKDVRVAAIQCLGSGDNDSTFLLEQSKHRAKDVRAAAFEALASIDEPEVIRVLKSTLASDDIGLVAEKITKNPNAELRAFVLEEAHRVLGELIAPTSKTPKPKPAAAKTKTKASTATAPDQQQLIERFRFLLMTLQDRKDQETADLLIRVLQHQQELSEIKVGYSGGTEVIERAARLILVMQKPEFLDELLKFGTDVISEIMPYQFMAASRRRGPEFAFEMFEPLVSTEAKGKSKSATSLKERAEAVVRSIVFAASRRNYGSGFRYYYQFEVVADAKPISIDPRWLDVAVAKRDLPFVLAILDRPLQAAWAFLTERVDEELSKKKAEPSYETLECIEGMFACEHPDRVPKSLAILQKMASNSTAWWSYHYSRVIQLLPASAIPDLEAMIPSVNARLLDVFVGAIDEMKQKAATV